MALLVNIQPAFKAFIRGTKMHLGGGNLNAHNPQISA